MIKLTYNVNGKTGAIYVPASIVVMEHEGKTFIAQSISDDGTGIEVTEPPEEVARKVLEYRLSVIRYAEWYRSGVELQPQGGESFHNCFTEKKYMQSLAGLEE